MINSNRCCGDSSFARLGEAMKMRRSLFVAAALLFSGLARAQETVTIDRLYRVRSGQKSSAWEPYSQPLVDEKEHLRAAGEFGSERNPQRWFRQAISRAMSESGGRERLGEIIAGFRHDLCRGSTTLCRIALCLCKAISRPDGTPGSRFD